MLLGHDSKSDMRLLGQCCYLSGMPTTVKWCCLVVLLIVQHSHKSEVRLWINAVIFGYGHSSKARQLGLELLLVWCATPKKKGCWVWPQQWS